MAAFLAAARVAAPVEMADTTIAESLLQDCLQKAEAVMEEEKRKLRKAEEVEKKWKLNEPAANSCR